MTRDIIVKVGFNEDEYLAMATVAESEGLSHPRYCGRLLRPGLGRLSWRNYRTSQAISKCPKWRKTGPIAVPITRYRSSRGRCDDPRKYRLGDRLRLPAGVDVVGMIDLALLLVVVLPMAATVMVFK